MKNMVKWTAALVCFAAALAASAALLGARDCTSQPASTYERLKWIRGLGDCIVVTDVVFSHCSRVVELEYCVYPSKDGFDVADGNTWAQVVCAGLQADGRQLFGVTSSYQVSAGVSPVCWYHNLIMRNDRASSVSGKNPKNIALADWGYTVRFKSSSDSALASNTATATFVTTGTSYRLDNIGWTTANVINPCAITFFGATDGTRTRQHTTNSYVGRFAIYSTDSTRIEHEFVPALVSGKVGMYDIVTGRFYRATGTLEYRTLDDRMSGAIVQ